MFQARDGKNAQLIDSLACVKLRSLAKTRLIYKTVMAMAAVVVVGGGASGEGATAHLGTSSLQVTTQRGV